MRYIPKTFIGLITFSMFSSSEKLWLLPSQLALVFSSLIFRSEQPPNFVHRGKQFTKRRFV